MAAQNGHTEVVRFLVQQGKADVDKAMTKGATPLFMAAQNGHLEVIKLLLDKGADWTVGMRDNGWSPLFVASWAGNAAAVAELLGRQAADPATATTSEHLGIPAGSTALSVAELQGHGDVAAALRSAV
jgi:ankyrin repeat protein